MAKKISRESQDLADQIHSVSIHLLRKLRREDEGSGLSAPRLSALSVIVFAGPVTLGALAAAEQVRPPTMTRIVNALEAQDLVTRGKNAGDGRSTFLSATPAGRKLMRRGRARRVRALARGIEDLPPRDRSLLREAAAILQGILRVI